MEEPPELGQKQGLKTKLPRIEKKRLWAHVVQDLESDSRLASWAPLLTHTEIYQLGRDTDFSFLWYLSSPFFALLKYILKK